MRLTSLTFVVVLALPSLVEAHALGVEVLLKDGKLVVNAFYDDDTNAAGAKVEIADGAKVLATGKTDKQGQCAFALPAPGKYQVLVDAGAGHRAKQTFTVPEKAGTAVDEAKKLEAGKKSPEAAGSKPPVRDGGESGQKEPSSGTVRLNEGPGRAETTAYPWVKIGLGVGIIGLLALAFVASRVFRTQ